VNRLDRLSGVDGEFRGHAIAPVGNVRDCLSNNRRATNKAKASDETKTILTRRNIRDICARQRETAAEIRCAAG
jgi:hypothetical protein